MSDTMEPGHRLAARWHRQLWGMAQFEALRLWRRRGLPIILLLWVATIAAYGLLLDVDGVMAGLPAYRQSLVFRRMMSTNVLLWATAVTALFFATVVVGIIVADTVAYDRQLGVTEWLHALPLNQTLYLAGKLGGVWTAVSVGVTLVAVFGGVTNGLQYGWFDTAVYLRLWANILPVTLISTGICVLLTTGFHRRRHATFAAFFLAIGCFLLLAPAVFSLSWQLNDAYFERELPLLQAEMCNLDATTCQTTKEPEIRGGLAELPLTLPDVTAVLLRGTAILLAAWGAAWVWLWRQNNLQ